MTTFRVYANFNDGRGVVRANETNYKKRERAEAEAVRLMRGATGVKKLPLVVPFREEEKGKSDAAHA